MLGKVDRYCRVWFEISPGSLDLEESDSPWKSCLTRPDFLQENTPSNTPTEAECYTLKQDFHREDLLHVDTTGCRVRLLPWCTPFNEKCLLKNM